jgi:formamidopyrimidine-DNA glycosylase
MPELPEVETVANGVNERVRGQRIESVWLSFKPQTFKTPVAEMLELLDGRRIERVRRVGKHIVFDFEDGGLEVGARPRSEPVVDQKLQWIVHLGMTGRLLVCEPEVPVPPHTHAILALSSGRELRFVDARRFGRLAIHRVAGDGEGFRGRDGSLCRFRSRISSGCFAGDDWRSNWRS